MKIKFILSLTVITAFTAISHGSSLKEEHQVVREELNDLDLKSRDVMSELYDLNTRMRTVSRRRDNINNRVLQLDSSVKKLAKEAASIEDLLNKQRASLSRRLRIIYKLNDEAVVRTVFSAADNKELDETMKYLRVISNNDFNLIRAYSRNLKNLTIKKEKLQTEVKKYLAAQDRLKKNEFLLTQDQETKKGLLEKIKGRRGEVFSRLENIRDLAKRYDLESMLDLSFYESKGKLSHAVSSIPARKFGVVEDDTFQFKLGHKGYTYVVDPNSDIHSVHQGRVVFNGEIQGNGKTMIVDHGDHFYTVYSKLDECLANEGDIVKAGQIIGKTGVQFYFELRHFSDAIDPESWFTNATRRNRGKSKSI